MSTLNFQDGYRRSSSVTLQLCSKVSAYKFLAQTTMIYHIWEQKYEDQFATSNCNIFKAIEEGGFMKNEIPFISIGTIFERLFIKGIIFRILQEIGRRDESLFYIWFYRWSHSYYLLLKNVKYKKCSRHTFYCVHIASQLIIS